MFNLHYLMLKCVFFLFFASFFLCNLLNLSFLFFAVQLVNIEIRLMIGLIGIWFKEKIVFRIL